MKRIIAGALALAPALLGLSAPLAHANPYCTSQTIHDTTYIRCYGPDGSLTSDTECWSSIPFSPGVSSCQDRTPRAYIPRGE